MTYPAHISEHAATSYAAGIDPVSYAEGEVTSLITAHFAAAFRAAFDPGAKPDLSNSAMARRILGLLMASGWTAPGGLEVPGSPEGLEAAS